MRAQVKLQFTPSFLRKNVTPAEAGAGIQCDIATKPSESNCYRNEKIALDYVDISIFIPLFLRKQESSAFGLPEICENTYILRFWIPVFTGMTGERSGMTQMSTQPSPFPLWGKVRMGAKMLAHRRLTCANAIFSSKLTSIDRMVSRGV